MDKTWRDHHRILPPGANTPRGVGIDIASTIGALNVRLPGVWPGVALLPGGGVRAGPANLLSKPLESPRLIMSPASGTGRTERAATRSRFRFRTLNHAQAIGLLVACACMWSVAGLISRKLEEAQSLEVTFWRSFFCLLAMGAGLGWHWRGEALQAVARIGRWGLFSAAMWAVMFTCFMIALTRTSVANTVVVMSLAPLLAAMLGRLVLKVTIPRATWVAIALAAGDRVKLGAAAWSLATVTTLAIALALTAVWGRWGNGGAGGVGRGETALALALGLAAGVMLSGLNAGTRRTIESAAAGPRVTWDEDRSAARSPGLVASERC